MDERRKSRGGGIVILLACGMLAGLYAAGYYGLAATRQFGPTCFNPTFYRSPVGIQRTYPHPLFVQLYYPAAKVEARLTGEMVIIGSSTDTLSEWDVVEP